MKEWIACALTITIVCLIGLLDVFVLSTPSAECYEEEIQREPEVMVVIRYATEEEEKQRDIETVKAIAQTVWGEARGCSITEQAAVIWCILNRVDSDDSNFPDDPLMVVQQNGQFDGYDPSYPVEQKIVALVEDVMGRWELEKTAFGSVGRVLPKEFTYFQGDGVRNWFRDSYKGGNVWDWSLESPYGEILHD